MNTTLRFHIPYFSLLFLTCCFLFASCDSGKQPKLPHFGQHEVVNGDTVYHKIPDFEFVNQDSQVITKETFQEQFFIIDYFFTSCPTICPRVKAEQLRIEEAFKNDSELAILSVSIDTRHDSVPVLKAYKEELEVSNKHWHFVTGDKDDIYGKAEGFFHVAVDDPDAPGGFDHDGNLILVDKSHHIRAYCNGTKPEEVDVFIQKIRQLKKEYAL